MRCRCHSRRAYKRCCQPLHEGRPAPTPLTLMRSRYCAYALGLTDYIQRTTDPSGPHHRHDTEAWTAELQAFSTGTRFTGLDILEAPEPDGDEGTVTFHAGLCRDGRDVGFAERSRFYRVDGHWLYHDGTPAG